MINIRYHIVSITAVFLALGIGVALGGTFLDRATVDLLDRNIGNAEIRIDAANKENARLSRELELAAERDTSLIVLGSEDLVADHLPEVPVLVVTAPGVDKDRVDALSTVLERTGASLYGTLEMTDRMAFDDEVDAGLAEDLGLEDPTVRELRNEVYSQLTAALATPGEAPGSQPEIVTILLDHEYLQLDPGPGRSDDDPVLDAPGFRYVFVGEPGLEPAQNATLLGLLSTEDEADPLPAVVISESAPVAAEGAPNQESAVTQVRASDTLATHYSTVDNAESFAGLVSTVYVLQQIDDLVPGHFGQADGATAVLPPVP